MTSATLQAPQPDPREEALRSSIARLDVPALATRFHAEDGLVVLPDLVPPHVVAELAAEARRLAPGARRTFAPFVRRAAAVGHYDIRSRAPALHALHLSPSLLALAQRLAGAALEHRRHDDAHASGLYVYDRRGDHVGWHYDDCGCVPDASFTVTLGVIDDSSSRLEVELHTRTPGRRPERRAIATSPGTLVFFRGSSVYHRVTPLGAGQQRILVLVRVREGGAPPEGLRSPLADGDRHLPLFRLEGDPARGARGLGAPAHGCFA